MHITATLLKATDNYIKRQSGGQTFIQKSCLNRLLCRGRRIDRKEKHKTH